jgi:hypothetical protein
MSSPLSRSEDIGGGHDSSHNRFAGMTVVPRDGKLQAGLHAAAEQKATNHCPRRNNHRDSGPVDHGMVRRQLGNQRSVRTGLAGPAAGARPRRQPLQRLSERERCVLGTESESLWGGQDADS